ncbi:MAG: hypothetical protein CM1200mP9_06580 [Gammaproteobacteria bacterium]|nr:MAG: hypothetical protein CM1200mP9_06580 [Gammaproteobacteria bacterium]
MPVSTGSGPSERFYWGPLEVIVGATTDPGFWKTCGFRIGGDLVEILQDVTFRLAPAESEDAHAMLDDIAGSKILYGVRGGKRRRSKSTRSGPSKTSGTWSTISLK